MDHYQPMWGKLQLAQGFSPANPLTRRTLLALLPAAALHAASKRPLYSLAVRPDGAQIALGGFQEVRLIDPTTGETKSTLEGHAECVRSVAYSADGKHLIAGGGLPGKSGQAIVWDIATGEKKAVAAGHKDCIYSVACSPDGRTFATSSYDKMIHLWDMAEGKPLRALKDHIDAIYAVAFTPDGKRLVSGAADRSVKIWNPESGERLYTFSDATDGINAVAIDPSGKRVAAAGIDKTIRIWLMGERGGELVNTLIAHEDAILQLAWSPDGSTIASGGADRSIKLFQASDLTEKKTFPQQPDWVTGLRFAPNSRSLFACRIDGSFQVYSQ
ncbi:MAG: WD40 repeat domain-containing protein, partial [Acidobacteria bacterium]|nr:WD40 repeat domain-containing protein [Acidobacteriota bacterium]